MNGLKNNIIFHDNIWSMGEINTTRFSKANYKICELQENGIFLGRSF